MEKAEYSKEECLASKTYQGTFINKANKCNSKRGDHAGGFSMAKRV